MPERPASAVVAARARLDRRQGGQVEGGGERERRRNCRRDARGSSGSTSSIRTRRIGRRRRSTRSTPARPYYGEVAATDAALAPLLDDLRAFGAADAGGRDRRSRRGARRPRRSVARSLRLRVDAADAAHHRASSAARSRSGGRGEVVVRAGAAHRHPADDPRRRRPPLGRSAGTFAADRGGAPLDRAARHSYFEAMAAMLNRGWAPLTGVIAGHDKLIDLPIAERYDLAADPRRAREPRGPLAERDRRSTAPARFGAAPPGERRAEAPEAAARLRALGYVSGSAAPKARYTEADDPKRLVDSIRRFTTRSRRSARAVRRSGTDYHGVSSRGGPTWRLRTGISRSSSGSAAIPRERSTRCARAQGRGRRFAARRPVGRISRGAGHWSEGIQLLESVANDAGGDSMP